MDLVVQWLVDVKPTLSWGLVVEQHCVCSRLCFTNRRSITHQSWMLLQRLGHAVGMAWRRYTAYRQWLQDIARGD